MTRTYRVADLFCGAGGSSTGAQRAIRELGGAMDLVAVNHWDIAISSHTRNHPTARHWCVNLDAARPESIVPEGSLDLLMASPECTFFSRARGGKPMNDQSRMSAWHVQRWASTLDVRCILVENVPEFRDWGPVLESGQPDKTKRGMYFQSWVQSLWAMGYEVDWKLLNAADYGDATTRTRFFLQARKDGVPIRWPAPSHARAGSGALFGPVRRWRAAREIIDWTHPGRSIFERKTPLSLKTRMRIARGLQRFGGELAPHYIRLLDLPADLPRSVTTASMQPFVLGQQSGSAPRSTAEPLPTIATDGAISVIDPTLIPYYGQSEAASVDVPLGTVTTHARFGLCQPMAVPYGPKAEARSIEEPLPTIMTRDRLGVCTPTAFLVPQFGERGDQAPRLHAIDDPLPAITSHGAGALVQPVAIPGESIDPRRLVTIDGQPYVLDILFRMLTNPELARAMGFDDAEITYEFAGTASQITKQIGNAVPVHLSAALVGAILPDAAVAAGSAA